MLEAAHHMKNKTSLVLLAGLGVAGVIAVACGSESSSNFGDPNGGPNGNGDQNADGSNSGDFGPAGEGGTRGVASLTIDPPTATIDITSAPFPTQKFVATAHYSDGSTGDVPISWSATNAPVGGVDSTGLFTPRGDQGGVVTITATGHGATATATLTVKFHQSENPANVDDTTKASLLAATNPDPTIVWTYPYDGMAYSRGLNAPEMMWNKNVAGDVYAVHVESPTYEFTSFTNGAASTTTAGTAPAGPRVFNFAQNQWNAFVSSTSGDAKVTVTRKTGSTFTKVIEQTWKIANRSMSGTIYYWAINQGAVVRIKPGASSPDTFLANATVPAPGELQYDGSTKTKMVCPSCHTVSADGSRLAMDTGRWDSTVEQWSTVYDLTTGTSTFNGYKTASPPSRYPLAGLSADGKVLVENWAAVRGSPGGQDDKPVDISAPSGTTGVFVENSGLETLVGSGHHTLFPAFSADNALFTYVDSSTAELYTLDWNATTKKFSNKVKVADKPASGKIAYPTISPDHRWIVYQVGPDFGSLDTSYLGDLYAVDLTNPNHPIALDAINKSMSGAATGARDQHRSYEPTFAPVASGGYFWIVFHSRRTYGNHLVDVPYTNGTEGSGTKQLWVAAIDVATGAAVTADPSHAPFWLPGQALGTRNMRGYWALDPCHSDGDSCSTGSDCCNGFCDATNDAGAPVCGKTSNTTCSQDGDKCDVATDCCSVGAVCINHACSEPPPK
jgi:hypothetical protein